jgi:hypothetical protein
VTREIALAGRPDVIVHATVGGPGTRDDVALHLDPDVGAEIDGDDVRLLTGGREAWLQMVTPAWRGADSEAGWSSPSYGVRSAIKGLLRGHSPSAYARFGLVWRGYRSIAYANWSVDLSHRIASWN